MIQINWGLTQILCVPIQVIMENKMFASANETSINRGLKSDSVISVLEEHTLRYYTTQDQHQFIEISKGEIGDIVVLGLVEGNKVTVKPFIHPVTYEVGGVKYIVIDVRTCAKFDQITQGPKITNKSLFKREAIRVLLDAVWMDGGRADILYLGHYQVQVFAAWVGELISRKFGLDGEQTLQVMVVCAFYYLCLFTDDSRADLHKFIPIISKVTRAGVPFVIQTLNGVEYLEDMEDMLKAIIAVVDSPRLAGLRGDVLVAMLAGSWFGASNSILVGTAIEYPPLWNTLMYLGMTESSQRASGIGKVALRRERDPIAREYLAAMGRLLMAYSTVNSQN